MEACPVTEREFQQLLEDGGPVPHRPRSGWQDTYKRWGRHPDGQRREFAKLIEQYRRTLSGH
jgi:hypothetical protein